MASKPLDSESLEAMTVNDLYELAKTRNIKNYRKLKKQDLIEEILDFEKAMHRRVNVTVASVPRESLSPMRPMTPLAFGDPESDDEMAEYPDIPEPVSGFADESERESRQRQFQGGYSRPESRQRRELPAPVPLSRPVKPAVVEEDNEFYEPPKPEPRVLKPRPVPAPAPVSTPRPVPAPAPIPEPAPPTRVRKFEFSEEEDRKAYIMPEKRDFDRYHEPAAPVPQIETEEVKPIREERERRPQIVSTTQAAADGELQKGVLDIHPEGTYGFVRQKEFKLGEEDIYVSISQIKKFGLRTGDLVEGVVRPPRDQERYKSLVKIERVNGASPEYYKQPKPFEKLVPVYPDDRLFLESDQYEISTRLLDLFSPIGRGQRAIIVAKPKAGKTVMLKKIAAAIAKNHPDIELIALLIDERPEEVTDFERTIDGKVISSTFDEKPENHIQVAELTIEYAKRRVEQGKDVMILLDSLTRLARSYNLTCPPSGKTLSGGLDPNSLYKPKRFLGAARNIEGGGSLTIISSALIETGSRLDDIIYEEFKGTANSEVHLIRELADKRIFPAVDLLKSGTRHEELLYNGEEMECLWQLRKMIADMDDAERMNRLINKLLKTKTNVELLLQVQKAVDSGY